MKNIDKYTKVFVETFKINKKLSKNLKYNSIPEDSVGHMRLEN